MGRPQSQLTESDFWKLYATIRTLLKTLYYYMYFWDKGIISQASKFLVPVKQYAVCIVWLVKLVPGLVPCRLTLSLSCWVGVCLTESQSRYPVGCLKVWWQSKTFVNMTSKDSLPHNGIHPESDWARTNIRQKAALRLVCCLYSYNSHSSAFPSVIKYVNIDQNFSVRREGLEC